jgi:hypothetical protein
MKRFFCLLLGTLFLTMPTPILAKIGVGVGSGKIQVEEKLKPGMIYELPPIDVLNTGDEAADYEMSVAYHQDQPQLSPKQDWFSFSPQEFHLEPGGIQSVKIKLNLPVRTAPGDYFAYLEAHPKKTVEKEGTSIGIAAAAKLYFTVEPANFLQGMYFKIVTFWKVNAPWPQRFVTLAAALLALVFVKKFFNIQVGLKGQREVDLPPAADNYLKASTPRTRNKRRRQK